MRVKDGRARDQRTVGLAPEGKEPGGHCPGVRRSWRKQANPFPCPSPHSGLFPPFQGTELTACQRCPGKGPRPQPVLVLG